jgi:hypothetical protein
MAKVELRGQDTTSVRQPKQLRHGCAPPLNLNR